MSEMTVAEAKAALKAAQDAERARQRIAREDRKRRMAAEGKPCKWCGLLVLDTDECVKRQGCRERWLKATALPGEWWHVVTEDYCGSVTHHVLIVGGTKGNPYFGGSRYDIVYAVQVAPPVPIIPTPFPTVDGGN